MADTLPVAPLSFTRGPAGSGRSRSGTPVAKPATSFGDTPMNPSASRGTRKSRPTQPTVAGDDLRPKAEPRAAEARGRANPSVWPDAKQPATSRRGAPSRKTTPDAALTSASPKSREVSAGAATVSQETNASSRPTASVDAGGRGAGSGGAWGNWGLGGGGGGGGGGGF